MKLKNSPSGVNSRRIGAKKRLDLSLANAESKLKKLQEIPADKQEVTYLDQYVSTERSIVRIKSEIAVLNSRIVTKDSALQNKSKKHR